MATNYILPFGTDNNSTNILTDSQLSTRTENATGFINKTQADGRLIGKLLQNALSGAYTLGQFVVKFADQDVSGSEHEQFATGFETALTAFLNANIDTAKFAVWAGGTFTGPITLSGDPTQDLHPATKQYVDSALQNVDLSDYLPLSGGTITGELNVPQPTTNTNAATKHYVDESITDLDIGQYATTESVTSQLALKANLANPTFTGTVVVPTPSAPNAAANKQYVDEAISNADLDQYATDQELAEGLAQKADTTALNNYMPIAGGMFTGPVTVQAPAGDNNPATKVYVDDAVEGLNIDQYATTAAMTAALADKADNSDLEPLMPKAGGAFTGPVTVQNPTANNHPATKAYVDNAVASVYKYRGSVANQQALPSSGQTIGDVYNLEDTGDNVAWDGTTWDRLAGVVDLSDYATKSEVNTKADDNEVVKLTGNQTIAGTKTFSSTISGSVSGNAGTATRLATARNITLAGDVTGSTSFNGSANVEIDATLAESGVTAGSYGPTANATPAFNATFNVPQLTVDAKGRVTSAATRTVRIPAAPTSVSGNAGTATRLATARNITLTGDAEGSASFNGSADAEIEVTVSHADAADSATTATRLSANKTFSLTGAVTGSASSNLSGNVSIATTYTAMKGATSSAAGTVGAVPAPAAGQQTRFLRGDGTWQVPTNTTYSVFKAATSSAAGGTGLVPAPASGENDEYLRGDGTWNIPPNNTMQQNASTANGAYPLLAKSTTATSNTNGQAIFDADTTLNPSTGLLTVGKLQSRATSTRWVDGAKDGGSILQATGVDSGDFVSFIRYKSNNGAFVLNGHQDGMILSYLTDANINNNTNTVTESLEFTEAGRLVSTGGFQGSLSGNASTASKLATARTIRTNLASTSTASFDGSGNVTPGVQGILGTANGGTGNDDGTVAKLTTARTFICNLESTTAGSFNGTANVTLGVSGELPTARGGTGRTDGRAQGLATARTIDGVSFNGTANIIHYGTCSTAAGTAAKTVSCSGFTLATGARIAVKFTVTNTATNSSVTLNVNNTGAKNIHYRGSGTAWSNGVLAANRIYEFVYDGSQYEFIGDIDTGSNNVTQTNTTTNANYPVLFRYNNNTSNGTAATRFCSGVQINPSSGTLSATVLSATSDARLKNIIDRTDDVDLSNVHSYRYTFKQDEQQIEHVGLIAQDVRKVLPQAVVSSGDHLSLDYNAIIAVLVDKINDLQHQIDQLKAAK